tara:strand:- start:120 stop:1040 length:921 start_codon:yes stop_codon:yes gene_type:complete
MSIIDNTNARTQRPIIVDCPPFNENNGGVIVLHMLVHELRALGVEAYAVSLEHEYADVQSPLLRALKRWNRRRRQGPFKTHPSLDVPLAKKEIYDDSIVVYPETRFGNPLNSQRVVRWLLNKPGFFGVDAKIGEDEEIFYFQEVFAEGMKGISDERLLQVRWMRDDIYQDIGLARFGACRMIRKGKYGGYVIPQPDDAIALDGKSHIEIARIFNTTEIFYCHDPYTAYLYYAVLCGCVPVVIPQPGLSSEDWRAGMDLRHGVAYGEDEIEWARDTSHQLILDMAATKDSDTISLRKFLATITLAFG